jgi:hypothetical protein
MRSGGVGGENYDEAFQPVSNSAFQQAGSPLRSSLAEMLTADNLFDIIKACR